MFAATPYLPRAVLLVFTALWGAGSVGLPMGLYGSDKYEKFFGRHMSRLILMAFSLMVVYAMYLSMIPVNTTTPALPSPSASDVPPATPPGQRASDVGMFWTVSYCVVAGLIMAGHIYS
jgi:predicted anti-sigma-YlaC factor YlaD